MTTSEKKLINNHISVLELVASLINFAETCGHRGISRSQFYEYKRRFQKHGIEGLKDFPSQPNNACRNTTIYIYYAEQFRI